MCLPSPWVVVPSLYGNACASINIYASGIFYVTIESGYYYGCTMSFRAKDIVYS